MKIQRSKIFLVLNDPVFRVTTTWLWMFIGTALLTLSIMIISGISISIPELTINYPDGRTKVEKIINLYYYGTCIEFVAVGLLPLIFTLICKDKIKIYGICWNGFVKSLSFSILFAMLFYVGPLFAGDNPFQFGQLNLYLNFPWNFLFVMTVIIIFGPLEMFFVIWLITNTDRIFKTKDRIFSWGVIITSVIFGVGNLFFMHNIFSALVHISTFFIFGLIYKYTKNSLGPMIGWTLVNGHIWFIASLLCQ
jgi:membrane protease YdiL (CAAX protease family)